MCCCLFSSGDAADSSALLVDRSRSPRGPRVADWSQCEWGEQLGAGAFAQVWAVRLPPFGDVAAKVLREDQRGDRAAASDIAREASLVCRLCHPHVLHGLLAHDHPAHGTVLVLPRIACTLAQHFRPPTQRTPCDDWRLARDWPLRRVLLVGLQLASALDYLHEHALAEHHVLHRDLKPDNVGLLGERGPRGVPCLLDFGCARMVPKAAAAAAPRRLASPPAAALPPDTAAAGEALAPPEMGAAAAAAEGDDPWNLTGQTGAARYMARDSPRFAEIRRDSPRFAGQRRARYMGTGRAVLRSLPTGSCFCALRQCFLSLL